jgi:hypothetical protein
MFPMAQLVHKYAHIYVRIYAGGIQALSAKVPNLSAIIEVLYRGKEGTCLKTGLETKGKKTEHVLSSCYLTNLKKYASNNY